MIFLLNCYIFLYLCCKTIYNPAIQGLPYKKEKSLFIIA